MSAAQVQQNRRQALVVPIFAALGAVGGTIAGIEGALTVNPWWKDEHPIAGALIGSALASFDPQAQQVGTSGLRNPRFP